MSHFDCKYPFDNNITLIDIFIFDVEGGDLEALQTMYWNIPGDFWVIELEF
jgi:hypothetical protein